MSALGNQFDEMVGEAFEDGKTWERERIIAILENSLICYDPAVFAEPPPGKHGTSRDQCSAAALRGFLTPLIAQLRTKAGTS